MELRIGTSGYSYPAWRGPFYPPELSPREMLRFYAGQLPAVEINNTFYRLPSEKVLAGWAEQVPQDFRFALKASQRITHHKRLRDAAEETGYLVRTARVLGARLGALLFQLPPNLAADLARLDAFLALLPDGLAAFEFRHASWDQPEVRARLAARGHAWVGADTDERCWEGPLPSGRWGYLRLRRAGYGAGELTDWAQRLAASGWERAFVFFKHEDEGAAPRLARELLALMGGAGRAGSAAAGRRGSAGPEGRRRDSPPTPAAGDPPAPARRRGAGRTGRGGPRAGR